MTHLDAVIALAREAGAAILDVYLREDLGEACLTSLDLKSEDARRYAEGFSWEAATDTFLEALERTSVTGNES